MQLCTFHVGDHLFGVDVMNVQEVIRDLTMTRVPLAPAEVRGLINLRGQIVPCIDMRLRLKFPPRSGGKAPMNVIARTDDGNISLLVDEIGDILEYNEAAVEAAPPNLPMHLRELITGVFKLDHALLLVLDIHVAVSIPSPSGAAA